MEGQHWGCRSHHWCPGVGTMLCRPSVSSLSPSCPLACPPAHQAPLKLYLFGTSLPPSTCSRSSRVGGPPPPMIGLQLDGHCLKKKNPRSYFVSLQADSSPMATRGTEHHLKCREEGKHPWAPPCNRWHHNPPPTTTAGHPLLCTSEGREPLPKQNQKKLFCAAAYRPIPSDYWRNQAPLEASGSHTAL